MKNKIIMICFLVLLEDTGCSSIIYAIRGPKYKGKFDGSKKIEFLELNKYYYYRWDAGKADSKGGVALPSLPIDYGGNGYFRSVTPNNYSLFKKTRINTEVVPTGSQENIKDNQVEADIQIGTSKNGINIVSNEKFEQIRQAILKRGQ